MEQNKKWYRRILMVLGVGILACVVLSSTYTYAYFTTQTSSDEQVIKTSTLKIEYTTVETTFNENKVHPIEEDEIESDASKVSFTVKNTGDANIYAIVSFENIIMTDVLETSDFIWELHNEGTIIAHGDFSNVVDPQKMVMVEEEIKVNETKAYTAYVYIKETNDDQSELMGQTFSMNIQVIGLIKK